MNDFEFKQQLIISIAPKVYEINYQNALNIDPKTIKTFGDIIGESIERTIQYANGLIEEMNTEKELKLNEGNNNKHL